MKSAEVASTIRSLVSVPLVLTVAVTAASDLVPTGTVL
jgi:hypothetical protein